VVDLSHPQRKQWRSSLKSWTQFGYPYNQCAHSGHKLIIAELPAKKGLPHSEQVNFSRPSETFAQFILFFNESLLVDLGFMA
jgi:hypothetical protein